MSNNCRSEPDIHSLQQQVFQDLIETRGRKYKWFLRGMKLSRFLLSSDRSNLLLSSYTGFRRIDDIVDGDAPLPSEYGSREEYVLERIATVTGGLDPVDIADYLLFDAFQRAGGLDIGSEVLDILNSMLFDARRVGKRKLFLEKELQEHFHMLDIRGTILGALKVFNENPRKYSNLRFLGEAARIYYNLRDFDEDVNEGYINIPIEDMKRYSIDIDGLTSQSPGVRDWFATQVDRGKELLGEHRKQITSIPFHPIGRIALSLMYEIPARRYFLRTSHVE